MRAVYRFILLCLFATGAARAEVPKEIRVGIYNADLIHQDAKKKYSQGHSGMLQFLQTQSGPSQSEFPSLAAAKLAAFDVVIVPCLDVNGLFQTPAGQKELPHFYH